MDNEVSKNELERALDLYNHNSRWYDKELEYIYRKSETVQKYLGGYKCFNRILKSIISTNVHNFYVPNGTHEESKWYHPN